MAKRFYLDTETGGTDPKTDALLTIGLVAYDDVRDEIVETAHILVLPEGLGITNKALEINGIDLEEHVKAALPRAKAAQTVRDFVVRHWGTNWKNAPAMVGHNVKFDDAFMNELWDTTGIKKPYQHLTQCTMNIALFLKDLGMLNIPNVKLPTLVEEFDLEEFEAHNALGDALATMRVHLAMLDYVKDSVGLPVS